MLNGWLSPPEGKWKLPFPGSRDGFQAETFHSKRDNKGPTVTIVTSARTSVPQDRMLKHSSREKNIL